jgi:hypothetical protein
MQALISEHSTQPEAASADHTAADDGLANTDGNMDGAPFKAVISTGRLKANETVPMSTLRAVLIEGQDTADSYTVNDSSTTPEHGDDVDLGGDLESEEVVGSRREVRRLFLQKPRQYGVEDVWSSIPPGNKTPDEAQRTANRTRIHNKTFAIVHHYETSLETISLVVQSAELKEAIRPVFDGYPGIDLNSPEPKFFPLFIPFLHRWDRLVKVVNDELNKSTESLLGLPKDTLDHDMEPLFRSKREYQQSGYIEYKYLGIPFVPVMVVVHRDKDDILSAGILKSQNNGTLTVSVLDWDGSVFGYDDVSWGFTHFDGFRKLTDLSYFPLTTHPDGQCIRRDLVERGKRFEELSARHLKQYSGVMMSYDKLSWREKSPVSV